MLLQEIQSLKSPVARMLLTELYEAMTEMIFVPNSYLPAAKQGKERVFENGRVYGRSVKSLINGMDEESDHEILRLEFEEEKEIRIQEYSDNMATGEVIAFRQYQRLMHNRRKSLAEAIEKA
jgi:hypothetical protein